MKKFATAITLFEKKHPDKEVKSIERTLTNWFTVTTSTNQQYTVSISDNTVDISYPDPDWR